MQPSGLFLASALGLSSAGCAFHPVNIDPPTPNDLAVNGRVGRGREVVVDYTMADERSDVRRCGTRKNWLGVETANVECSLAPDRWMAEALTQGLLEAGFLVLGNPERLSPTTPRIQGVLTQFFVEPVTGFGAGKMEADVGVSLRMRSPNGLIATRSFYFKSQKFVLTEMEDGFQPASTEVTRKAVETMVVAVAELLDQYPELGAPMSVAGNGGSYDGNAP